MSWYELSNSSVLELGNLNDENQIFGYFDKTISATVDGIRLIVKSDFMIAQEKNQNGKPMYGVDIFGANWQFVIMEGREYCISKPLSAVDKDGLLKIIALLRKFRYILETRLMD